MQVFSAFLLLSSVFFLLRKFSGSLLCFFLSFPPSILSFSFLPPLLHAKNHVFIGKYMHAFRVCAVVGLLVALCIFAEIRGLQCSGPPLPLRRVCRAVLCTVPLSEQCSTCNFGFLQFNPSKFDWFNCTPN